jgi:hypothetical protein
MLNKLSFYTTTTSDNTQLEQARIWIEGNEYKGTLNFFISHEIRNSKILCENWILRVKDALYFPDYNYSEIGNACTVSIRHSVFNISNEYIDDSPVHIDLQNMKIILTKWLEFLNQLMPIDFEWESGQPLLPPQNLP